MFACKSTGLCRHQDLTKGETLCCYYGECKYKEELKYDIHNMVD